MSSIAVLYASGMTKNTERIARYIGRKADADLFDLKSMSIIDLKEYRTIVFGTGIHAGKPYKQVVSFIQDNRAQLDGKDVKLFISCMYNGDKGRSQCIAVSKQLGIPDAAAYLGCSAQYLNRKFSARYGHGVRRALIELRLARAYELLADGGYTVADAARLTGWSCPFYFSNSFRKFHGLPPGRVRKERTS